MKIKISKKYLKKIYIILLSCVIITIITAYIVYASLGYWFKDINISANITVRIMPDSTAFHWYISEYNAIDGVRYPVSLNGPMIDTNEMNMKGYGKYHMQMQYNLANFIAYCHSKSEYASIIETLCQSGDQNKEFPESLNYESLTTKLSGQASYGSSFKTTLNTLWSNMCTSFGPAFETLQDEFIAKKYLLPAINKMRLSDTEYREIFHQPGNYVLSLNDIENLDGDEFMTALLSSVYNDFYTADMSSISANNIDIGRANLVPFLYNVDETGTTGRDIAKYAYVAYIEGFLVSGRTDGFHYWEQEYEAVFGESYDLSEDEIETLRIKFENAMSVLNIDGEQGNKGNRLLGSTIIEVIRSPYNVSTQLAQTKNIINNILGDVGIDSEYKDLIAKNYLMVKHMMDNSHIDDTIKDYCQGVVFNESKFSQGQFDEKNTKTAVLSDFQLVTLKDDVIKKNETHSDDDSVFDGEELGAQVKHDITAFVKKKLNAGEDLWTKANAWKEFNDMIVVEGTSSADCKVYAKMYDYKSNPVLNDTDFDGLDDLEEKGKAPLSNNFKENSMTTFDGNLNIDFNTDFRYLMYNDMKYNDELAQQSLIMANLARGETINLTQKSINYGTMNIEQYMAKLGFKEIDQDTVLHEMGRMFRIAGYKYYIGYKSIDYYRKNRGVIGIFISELQNDDIYEKMVIDDASIRNHNYYKEIAEWLYNKIDISKLDSLVDKYDLKYCYWISGKGIAGGIASELAHLIRHEKNDKNDIYCYTFGSPKTRIEGKKDVDSFIKNIINEDDYLTKVLIEQNAHRVGDEYNASVNTDFRYNHRNLTRNDPKYTGNYMKVNSINNKIKEYKKNRTLPQNLIKDLSKYLQKKIGRSLVTGEDFNNSRQDTEIKEIITAYDTHSNNQEFETASSIKAYWTLAKVLEGIDNKMTNGRKYEKTNEEAKSEIWDYNKTDADREYEENYETLLEAIETVGRAYLDNVYTYLGASRYSYTGEDSIENQIAKKITNQNITEFDVEDVIFNEKKKMKTSTINAYEKWNERKEQVYENIYRQVKGNIVSSDEELTDEKKEIIINLSKQTIKTIYSQMKAADDNQTALHHLDVLDEYVTHNKRHIRYNYDNTINLGFANKESYVGDDCSSFAAAVYWYYLNNISKSKDKTKIDLWTTGSSQFVSTRYSYYILNVLLENGFAIYQWKTDNTKGIIGIEDRADFELKPGDLLYRAQQNGKVAHVEFYLGEGHSFGWGELHSDYDNNDKSKYFEIIRDLNTYNVGKTRKASQVSSGEIYKIEGNNGAGIYNTIKAYDANCRYDYVIRLEKQITEQEEVNE